MSCKIIINRTSIVYFGGKYFTWSANGYVDNDENHFPNEINLSNIVADSAEIEGLGVVGTHERIRQMAHDYMASVLDTGSE